MFFTIQRCWSGKKIKKLVKQWMPRAILRTRTIGSSPWYSTWVAYSTHQTSVPLWYPGFYPGIEENGVKYLYPGGDSLLRLGIYSKPLTSQVFLTGFIITQPQNNHETSQVRLAYPLKCTTLAVIVPSQARKFTNSTS